MADYNSSYTGAEIDAAIAAARGAPTTYAPIAHDDAATTYGKGSSSKYGHVQLSDSTSSTSDTTGGVAATPKAVKAAYDLANGKQSALTFDNSPTQNSSNPVTSGGIYTALQSAGSTGTGATWIWDKGTGQPAYVVNNDINFSETDSVLIENSSNTATTTVTYYDNAIASDLVFDGTNAFVVLTGAHTVTGSQQTYTNFNVLKGKYCYLWGDFTAAVYIPTNATISTYTAGSGDTNRYKVRVSTTYYTYCVLSTFSHTEYVSDTSSSAYPEDGTSGGYYYKRLGQVGSALDKNARIETVTHVGTGTYEEQNPTEVTFSFVPKMVFVSENYSSYGWSSGGAFDATCLSSSYVAFRPLGWTGSSSVYTMAKLSGTTLSFYADYADLQFNTSGVQYLFTAIG